LATCGARARASGSHSDPEQATDAVASCARIDILLRYESTARGFLGEHAVREGVLVPQLLTGADVKAFLLCECGRVSAGSAKGRVAELRARC